MAKKQKDSFILYMNWEDSFNLLSEGEKAQFITNLFLFHKGEEVILNTPMLSMFWKSIEFNLNRNIQRYETAVENGSKGGAPKGNKNALKEKYYDEEQPTNNQIQPRIKQIQPTNNLNDNDNDNGNVNGNVNVNANGNVKGNVKGIIDKAFTILSEYNHSDDIIDKARFQIIEAGGFDAAADIMEWDEDVKQNWYKRVSVNL